MVLIACYERRPSPRYSAPLSHGLCSFHMDCAVFTWTVQPSHGMCSLHVDCADFTWTVQSSRGPCSLHMDCAVFTWTVQSSRGLCRLHMNCAVFTWTVQASHGLPLCAILTRLDSSRQILLKPNIIKFHKNLYSGGSGAPCRTDRHDEENSNFLRI